MYASGTHSIVQNIFRLRNISTGFFSLSILFLIGSPFSLLIQLASARHNFPAQLELFIHLIELLYTYIKSINLY